MTTSIASRAAFGAMALALVLAGCGSSAPADGAAGADADATPSALDAPDAAPDATVAPDADRGDEATDAPTDADPFDAAPDATLDAATDATDALLDAARDVALDAPDARDAALDAALDARDAGDAAAYDAAMPDGTWRSALYPATWAPVHAGGRPTTDGRFLHDFSFAGYHRGDTAPPYGRGTVRATLAAADYGDGRLDATAAIQRAIDAACAVGGGVVALGPGSFTVRLPSSTATSALRIACSGVVLRGAGSAGAAATRLVFDDPTRARARSVILVQPTSFNALSGDATRPERALTADAPLPTRVLSVASTDGLAVGAHVVVRTTLTDAFRAEHRMDPATSGLSGLWPATSAAGLQYARTLVAVDPAARRITLDAPTRYALRTRDMARVFRTAGVISEVGLEDFAIGMREHATSAAGTMPGPLRDAADDAYDTPGTAAYDVHASAAIRIEGARDGWVYRVATFQPAGNASGAHVLSLGLFLVDRSSRFTVESCDFRNPQYRGGGGNGYLYLVQGQDHLILRDRAVDGRHNFILSSMAASGNAFVRVETVDARYSDDSHRMLSQANLYDGVVARRAWLQSANRGTTSTGAGYTATQTVYWNTRGAATHPGARGFLIETAQWGFGYAIGTSADPGATAMVSPRIVTNGTWAALEQGPPPDHIEGVGMGATLWPPSLYDDQLARRRARGE